MRAKNLNFVKFWKDRHHSRILGLPHTRYEEIWLRCSEMDGLTDEADSNISTWWPGPGGDKYEKMSIFCTQNRSCWCRYCAQKELWHLQIIWNCASINIKLLYRYITWSTLSIRYSKKLSPVRNDIHVTLLFVSIDDSNL